MTGREEDRAILQRVETDLDRHVATIAQEFREGFEAVDAIGRPAVTIYGSARITAGDPAYERARDIGGRFAKAGFAVVTGGGPGIMEAANRGCQESGGLSIGFNIELPHEQSVNAYLDRSLTFKHFYARKTMLVKAAEGFVLCEGGFGTLDELFESLVLIQTGTIRHFPVVLVGSEHWHGLQEWVEEKLIGEKLISPEDVLLLSLTDDPAEAVRLVIDCYEENCSEIEATG
ncbi:MAG TPA: TIGR00730 family Rossman fold protein [Gaiellaceae bacterium]|nr:TIGR00730 family Rossman fold protein [Gaiellaceae bacterium]